MCEREKRNQRLAEAFGSARATMAERQLMPVFTEDLLEAIRANSIKFILKIEEVFQKLIASPVK